MPALPIIEYPNPRLRVVTAPVETDRVADPAFQRLLDDMLQTMYEAPGIGLAAPQVGVGLRLVVLDVGPREKPEPMVLVNPEIVAQSAERAIREEGCLSLPGQFADVERPARIRLRWRELDGARREMEAQGLLGVCLQHEIDHLDGVLFVDHLSALKRNMLLRKLAKEQKAKARSE